MHEAIAQALANLQQPDLTGFPDAQVWEAMNKLLTTTEALAGLRARIEELSNGMTRIEDANKDDFQYQSKEWGAVYQRLAGLFTDRLVIFGNSTPQILFVPHK